MKKIKPSENPRQWPRKETKSIDCRKRDLVIRIADWTRDGDEPAYDVEIYCGGAYDFNLSKSFLTKNANKTKKQAKREAIEFAQKKVAELL